MNSFKYKIGGLLSLLFIFCLGFVSCDYEFDLPEAGSIADATLPVASFSFSQTDPEDFRVVSFSNTSVSSTDFAWNFGNGDTSTDANPSYTFDGEGTYTVTLTSSDKNGVSDTVTKEITVIKPEEPDAITPTVNNGDFSLGQDGWKISSFTDGTTSPYNSSSDGSPIDYDGNDTGAKTAGAKWTNGTSAAHLLSGNSRFAYQAFTVSPNTTYVVEWEYAIKADKEDVTGGDRVVLNVIDGHYSDGKDALSAPILYEHMGLNALGKGNFTFVKEEFESNDSGLIAIWIYGVTSEDAYADNIKLYPKE